MLYIDHTALHISLHFVCGDPQKFYATQGPTERVGNSTVLYLSSLEYRYKDGVGFNYFSLLKLFINKIYERR